MNTILFFLLEVILTLAICLLVCSLPAPISHRILADLCGTEERAQFWTVFSSIILVGLPLLISLTYQPEASSAEALFFEITRRISGNLMGFLLALIGIGFIVSFFALVAPRQKRRHNENRSDRRIQLFGKVHHQTFAGTRRGSHHADQSPQPPDPFDGKVKAFPLGFSNENELENNPCAAWMCSSIPIGCGLTKAATPNQKQWKIQRFW
jgi:hypothetical protein